MYAFMSVLNQFKQVDINQVFVRGKISFGQNLYNGFTFSEKLQGNNSSYGSHSSTTLASQNIIKDNDCIDQSDWMNE